jgi:tRNA (cytidine(34)-2'-O)-methyltransferase
MHIALYEPDIPQNTGTVLRLCACLGIKTHIIEPAGFATSDRTFRRAGMDYLDAVSLTRHTSWRHFEEWRRRERLRVVLFTTAGTVPYLDYGFAPDDILLFGRGRRPPRYPHAAWLAFAQCRHCRRPRCGRSAAADRRDAEDAISGTLPLRILYIMLIYKHAEP